MRVSLPTLLLAAFVGLCSCPAQAQWAVQDQNGTPIPNSSGPYELYEKATGNAINTYSRQMLTDVEAGQASYDYLSCFSPHPGGYGFYPYSAPAWGEGLMTGGSYNLYAYVTAGDVAYFNSSPVGFYQGTPLTGSIRQDMTAPLFAKFLWTPPTPAPAPPTLGVLTTSNLSAQVQEYYSTNGPTTGLSGSVTSSASFGSVSDTLTANDSNLSPPPLIARHTLVLPVTSNTATLTGQSHAVSYANNPIVYSYAQNSSAIVYSNGIVSATVSPIVLTAPNPLTNPMLGDGTNQFVYDATTPEGYLYFPGAVNVVGGNAGDTDWLLRDPQAGQAHATLTADLPTESVERDAGLVDHNNLSSVPDSAMVVKYGDFAPNPPGPSDGFRFRGLPYINDDFGDHLVTLKVDGATTQEAHIQTFFSGLASNYPGADFEYAVSSRDPNKKFYTPNWYHYYAQVEIPAGSYEPGKGGTHTDFYDPYTIHITNQIYGDIPGTHLYALKPGAQYISYAGDVELYGLWLYIAANAHEQEHQDATGDGTYAVDSMTGPAPFLAITSDGDRLDDTWENKHYFKSSDPNTTMAEPYPNETDMPDDEVIADIVGIGSFLDSLDDWHQDWAGVPTGASYMGGIQFGTSHLAIKPGETIPTPFFWFTPGSVDSAGHITHGTRIKIWSKADLQAAVPNLMTALLEKPARP